jgi:hypothetical protein
MSYVGDIALGQTIDIKFTTRQISGAPFALSGGVISAYVGNGTTQITNGITLSADFDGVTGLNNVRVVATGGNGFTTATDIQLVITTGTVNSVSVVGEVIAEFSIENRQSNVKFWNGTAVATPATAGIPEVNVKNWNNLAAVELPLVPTTAGRKLDVSAGGEAGLDWIVASVSGAVGSVTGAVGSVTGNVGGNVVGSVGSVTGAVGSVTGAVGSVTGAVGSVTGNVGGNVVGSVASVAGNVTGSVLGNVAGSVGSVAGNVSGSVGSVAANGIDAASLAASAGTEIADAVKAIQLVEGYAVLGAAPTMQQALMAILQKLFERSVAGTTETINGLDGVTPVMTETINNAVTPTAITRAT